ncbi:Cyclin, C-terminal domain [Dillenia turbinata]|uniref:Cyclin, C-terminal domain n=1 Tax=Dillenia turbinata TaxID=194707 RepID=A0AAN8ZDL7_9MAGN
MENSILDSLAWYLLFQHLMFFSLVSSKPQFLTSSSLRCSLHLGKVPAWNKTLKLHTGFSESQLIDYAKLLVSFHFAAPTSKLDAIYAKYSKSSRCFVALLPLAKGLLYQESVESCLPAFIVQHLQGSLDEVLEILEVFCLPRRGTQESWKCSVALLPSCKKSALDILLYRNQKFQTTTYFYILLVEYGAPQVVYFMGVGKGKGGTSNQLLVQIQKLLPAPGLDGKCA